MQKVNSNAFTYLAWGTLCYLGRVIWLTALYHPVFGFEGTGDIMTAALPFIVHYGGAAIGTLVGGIVFDKALSSNQNRFHICALFSIIAAGLCITTYFAGMYVLFILALWLGSGVVFCIHGVMLADVFRKITYSLKPLVLGGAFSLCSLIQLPTDFIASRDTSIASLAYALTATLAMLVLAVLLWVRWPAFDLKEQGRPPVGLRVKPNLKTLLGLGLLASALMYSLHFVGEAISATYPHIRQSIFLLRVSQVAGPILIGLFCTRFGRYATVIGSVCLSGISVLGFLFSYGMPYGQVLNIIALMGYYMFALPTRTLFADLSAYSKRPGTITTLGFSVYYLCQISGVPLGSLIVGLKEPLGISVYLILALFAGAVIVWFYSHMQSFRVATGNKGIEPDVAASRKTLSKEELAQYKFTNRELEILPFILGPLTSEEIAGELYISVNTLKTHIRNILGKTQTSTRRELQKLLIGRNEEHYIVSLQDSDPAPNPAD